MKKLFYFIFFLIMTFTWAGSADSTMVRYKDRNGNIHYINTDVSKVPAEYADQVKEQLETKAAPPLETFILSAQPFVPPKDPHGKAKFRLYMLADQLIKMKLLPDGVDCTQAMLSYRVSGGEVYTVGIENISTVPEGRLPQLTIQMALLQDKINKAQGKPTQDPVLVDFFVRAGCKKCEELEAMLKTEGIRYTRYDVDMDDEGKKRYELSPKKELPYTRIGVGRYLVYGVDLQAIQAALKALEEPWSAK